MHTGCWLGGRQALQIPQSWGLLCFGKVEPVALNDERFIFCYLVEQSSRTLSMPGLVSRKAGGGMAWPGTGTSSEPPVSLLTVLRIKKLQL